MKVHYHSEMSFPWPPGREYTQLDIDLDGPDVPVLLQRDLRDRKPEEMFHDWYEWKYLGITHYYWIRPVGWPCCGVDS